MIKIRRAMSTSAVEVLVTPATQTVTIRVLEVAAEPEVVLKERS